MSGTLLPLARKDGLKVQTVANETLVYDTGTDKAYVLNPSAAAVWKACNGERTIKELVLFVNRETPANEQVVLYALGQLNPLLEVPVTIPRELAGISRRKFLTRAGLVAAATAVPLVISLVAPPPAAAQSIILFCCTCNNGSQFNSINCGICEADCTALGGVDTCTSGECPI